MIGKILGDRYEIIREIGSGGMANVYLAHCKLLNRNVAIKILKAEFADDPDFLKRFITEAQAAAGLSHPNIVSIYDYGREGDLRYIVMEYVEGMTLKEYIDEKGVLSWQHSLNYATQICKALENAHAHGIVHRDIKPHNIIITRDGILKVTDFGIARAATSKTVTLDGDTTMGSVHYFSPEQARGGYTDAKSDIYSLGVVMYEMLTGRVPFTGDTPVAIAVKHIQIPPVSPKEYNPSIPPAVEAIVLKAMCKDQSSRYQTATQMLVDLNSAAIMPNVVSEVAANRDSMNGETIMIKKNDVLGAVDDTPVYNRAPVRNYERREEETMRYVQNSKYNGAKGKSNGTNGKKKKKGQSPEDKKAVIWAVITCVILVALIIVGINAFNGGLFGNKQQVTVPPLVGENYEDMVEKYKDQDITIVIGQEVEDSEYDEGVIVEQSPKAGKTVIPPVEITVNVSKGVETIKIGNYIDKEASKVESELDKKGLKVKIEKEADEEIEKGNIIRTSPANGESVKKGDTVILYVSTGPETKEITMPNLLGYSLASARNILKENNLTEGTVSYETSTTAAKDTVIRQSFNPGDSVKEKTAISIVVSSGPPEVVNPTQAPVHNDPPAATPTPKPDIVDGVGGAGMVSE